MHACLSQQWNEYKYDTYRLAILDLALKFCQSMWYINGRLRHDTISQLYIFLNDTEECFSKFKFRKHDRLNKLLCRQE